MSLVEVMRCMLLTTCDEPAGSVYTVFGFGFLVMLCLALVAAMWPGWDWVTDRALTAVHGALWGTARSSGRFLVRVDEWGREHTLDLACFLVVLGFVIFVMVYALPCMGANARCTF
jgi:hypothetical protein